MPYEKIGDNEPICIAEEVPFEIPDSWEWVRLNNVLEIARGGSPRPIQSFLTTKKNGIPWIKIGDTHKGDKYITSTKEFIIPEGVAKSRMVYKGDFLLTNSMSFGRPYILNIDGCIHDGWLVLSNLFNAFYIDYLYYLLSSTYVYYQFCNCVSGAVVKNLNSEKVAKALIPLPPLQEQERIVDKIKEIEPYIKDYDIAYEKIEKLNKDFPEQLKKSILQDAVQGKLVPQDENDEPASVLIEKIRQEKAQLIKEKKIKKDKNESYIFRRDNSHYEKVNGKEICIDDLLPFEIPENWMWVRLNSIVELITKGSSPKWQGINYVKNNGILFLTSENVGSFSLLLNKKKFVESKFNILSPRSILKKNDFLMNIVGASIGRTALFNIEENNANINQATCIIRILEKYKRFELLNYLLLFFNSSTCYSYMCDNLVDCARANLSMSNIADFLIPLPPLNEQKRIVEKYYNALKNIERLTK